MPALFAARLCVACSGFQLAYLLAAGYEVSGTVRSAGKAAQLTATGINAVILDSVAPTSTQMEVCVQQLS